MPDLLESDLIARAQGGERTALEALVRRHQDAVFRFARSLTSNEASAEDVLQETFVAAVTQLKTYRGEGSFGAWLFTIAKRVAIRSRRRRSGEPERLESLEDLGQRAGWGADESVEGRLAERDAVRHAFDGLSSDDRDVLALRDIEGLSAKEAAAVLGVSVRALKSRLHRARLRFAANLRGGASHGARP